MSPSFAERRSQTQALLDIAFWLQPQSRPTPVSIDQFETLCGSIRGRRFDADLAINLVLNSALDMAEGFLIEESAILGYKLDGFSMPDGFTLVSRLSKGDPGKELDLVIIALQSIIDGNEVISSRSEITERLKKLIDAKDTLDNNPSELHKVFSTIEERIEQYEEVSQEEVQEFIDKIERDRSYQTQFYPFKNRAILLEGVKHVYFVQKAYLGTTTINKFYYEPLFSAMTSLVDRLTDEDLEIALTESREFFLKVATKKRLYDPDFNAEAIKAVKKGKMFATRVLIQGWKGACEQLAKLLEENTDKSMILSVQILSDLPPPLYKFLLLDNDVKLLRILFSSTGPFFADYFKRPLGCLVHSGVYPLHKLLNEMLKASERNRPLFAKILDCHVLRGCIENAAKTDDWEETAQSLVSAMNVLAGFNMVDARLISNLLTHMKKSSKDKSDDSKWLARYDKDDKVAEWIGMKKKEEVTPVKSARKTDEDQSKKKDEKTKKVEVEGDKKAEDEKKKNEEEITPKKEEFKRGDEKRGSRRGAESAKKKNKKREKREQNYEKRNGKLKEPMQQESKEKEKAEQKTKGVDRDGRRRGQASRSLSGDAVTKADEKIADQVSIIKMPQGEAATKAGTADADQVPSDQTGPTGQDSGPASSKEENKKEEAPPNQPIPDREEREQKERDVEGLAVTQNSTNSQDDGFTRSITNMDQIGNV